MSTKLAVTRRLSSEVKHFSSGTFPTLVTGGSMMLAPVRVSLSPLALAQEGQMAPRYANSGQADHSPGVHGGADLGMAAGLTEAQQWQQEPLLLVGREAP